MLHQPPRSTGTSYYKIVLLDQIFKISSKRPLVSQLLTSCPGPKLFLQRQVLSYKSVTSPCYTSVNINKDTFLSPSSVI